jgi:exosome complex component RRP41
VVSLLVISVLLSYASRLSIHNAAIGILPTAINATTLALIDAGVSMSDYITSLSVGLHLTQPLLDLSSPEESDIPYLVVASLPGSGKVTLATLETRIHVDRFEEMLAVGVEGCKVLKTEMEGEVKKRTGTMVQRMKLNALPDRAAGRDFDRDILMT